MKPCPAALAVALVTAVSVQACSSSDTSAGPTGAPSGDAGLSAAAVGDANADQWLDAFVVDAAVEAAARGDSGSGGPSGNDAAGIDASRVGADGDAGADAPALPVATEGGIGVSNESGADSAAPGTSPLLAILDQFTAADVPAMGPTESMPMGRSWPAPATLPTVPGNGLSEHPMLYAGEGYNTLFLVNHGNVVWTYSAGSPGEIDDVWMLTNGHILFAFQFHVQEVTPKKQVVWHYDPPAGTEIHSCQPIGLDRVLVVQNGLPPKLMILNKATGAVEVEHALPALSLTNQATVHGQFRRVRITASGTYLATFLNMNQVVEYDKAFNPIWTYPLPGVWAAARLHNGNTLVTDESGRLVREVSPQSATVWEFRQTDLPAGVMQGNTQSAERLANGNTVLFSSTGGSAPANYPTLVQAVEVRLDKKVTWILRDWKDLGPATTAQFLDQPGIPENPGDLQR